MLLKNLKSQISNFKFQKKSKSQNPNPKKNPKTQAPNKFQNSNLRFQIKISNLKLQVPKKFQTPNLRSPVSEPLVFVWFFGICILGFLVTNGSPPKAGANCNKCYLPNLILPFG
jgi:hypothetical protein